MAGDQAIVVVQKCKPRLRRALFRTRHAADTLGVQYAKTHHGKHIVVRGDSIMSLDPAPQALVNEHLLARRSGRHPDRPHHRPTCFQAVAGSVFVHMTRVQAERTVVPMPPAADWDSNDRLAASAAKRAVSRFNFRLPRSVPALAPRARAAFVLSLAASSIRLPERIRVCTLDFIDVVFRLALAAALRIVHDPTLSYAQSMVRVERGRLQSSRPLSCFEAARSYPTSTADGPARACSGRDGQLCARKVWRPVAARSGHYGQHDQIPCPSGPGVAALAVGRQADRVSREVNETIKQKKETRLPAGTTAERSHRSRRLPVDLGRLHQASFQVESDTQAVRIVPAESV